MGCIKSGRRFRIHAERSLNSPAAVRALLQHRIAGLPHEVLVVLFLDAQHRVIEIEELFGRVLTPTSVYPREVVKVTLKANAAARAAGRRSSRHSPHP